MGGTRGLTCVRQVLGHRTTPPDPEDSLSSKVLQVSFWKEKSERSSEVRESEEMKLGFQGRAHQAVTSLFSAKCPHSANID